MSPESATPGAQTKNFHRAYSKLSRAQMEAVTTIDGPVLVVAGPGTGKTEILTLRIGAILERTDTAPEQILALTFTEAGVAAMRERLVQHIGSTAYRVSIHTFHGFAGSVIGRFPEYFSELVGSHVASKLDQIMLMQRVLDSTTLERLASPRAPYHYLEKTLAAISLLKREAIGPEELSRRLDHEEKGVKAQDDYRYVKGLYRGKIKGVYLKQEEMIEKNRELVTLYAAYEQALMQSKLYDYDDMVLALVRSLEQKSDLRLILQEEYQYLLADEYQDGNGAQNKVLELLAAFHPSPNIFVVGDERQAIYRFQGASHENFTRFRSAYPTAKVITLRENYRSTQTILDASSTGLAAHAKHRESRITVYEYATRQDEASGIAKEIQKKITRGTPAEEIAIFTRTNEELAIYRAALLRCGIKVRAEAKEDILDDVHIAKLLTLIEASAHVGDDTRLTRALHLDCFAIDEFELYTHAREAARARRSLWVTKNKGAVRRATQLILTWAKQGANVSPAELVSLILRESDILTQILAHPDALNILEKIARLLTYLEEYVKINRSARLGEIAHVLELLDEYNVLDHTRNSHGPGHVALMTAHRAKGLEFREVYLVGATDGVWGGRANRISFRLPGIVASTKEEEELDEQNLWYVALTRAKRQLTITYATNREDGRAQLPSRYLLLMPEKLLRKTVFDGASEGGLLGLKEKATEILTLAPEPNTRADIEALVRETFLERGLAVTGLNNYLSCPWKYFYRNLLRIPEPQTVPLMFGNAVHRTLKRFFDRYAKGTDMSKVELLRTFETELEREYLTDTELVQTKKDGRRALGTYYDGCKGLWIRESKHEFSVDVLLPLDSLQHSSGQDARGQARELLRLTGKLDKLEALQDGTVRVVDYKTGKPKSRNEILGTTKNSEGDYHRQLVFYKLLLDRYRDGMYRMQTGVIEFVVPDMRTGRCKREIFAISREEVVMLEQTVARVAKEILTLAFWNKRCGEVGCAYCKLRDIL